MNRSRVSLIAKVAVATLLIVYLIRSGHLDPKDLLGLVTPTHVAVGLAIVGVNILLAAWRWILLLRSREFHIPFGYGVGLYLIGIFFNHALPGAVGGDFVRGYYLVGDHPDKRMDAVLSVVIDRVLGLYSFFILTLVAVAFDFSFVSSHEQIRWVAAMCLLVFCGLTGFFTVVFSKRLSHLFGLKILERKLQPLHRLIVSLQLFGRSRRVIAYSVAVSLLAQLVTMFFFYGMAIISGEPDVTWKAVLFAVPMGFLVTAVPIAPAGVGVGQVAFLYLFNAYLQRQTQFGANAITAFQLGVACWALVGAFLYMRRRKPEDLARMSQMAEAGESL